MTETALVKSLSDIERDTEAVSLTERALHIANEAAILKITDARSNVHAGDLRLKAKALEDALDVRRKFFVDPHNQFVKTINGYFKKPISQLSDAIDTINKLMVIYDDKVRADAAEEERRILADKRTLPETKSEKLAEIPQAPKVVTSSAGQTSFRIDKRLQIVDATIIPMEYMIPCESLILAALKAGKYVPGAILIEVKTPVGRSTF